MFKSLSIVFHNGRQFIPDIRGTKLAPPFRGLPIIRRIKADDKKIAAFCPVGAIGTKPLSIDLGKCVFCGECAFAFPQKISFTSDHVISTNIRERLIVKEGDELPVRTDRDAVRKEIKKICGRSLKLREISAAGDNSAEWEMTASGNVQFDMSRFGIEFVASPKHADGILITGPISENMAQAVDICYEAAADPQIIILAGTDAISGGIFKDSSALQRDFIAKHNIDLYIPGNPPHPLTIINGLIDLMSWD